MSRNKFLQEKPSLNNECCYSWISIMLCGNWIGGNGKYPHAFCHVVYTEISKLSAVASILIINEWWGQPGRRRRKELGLAWDVINGHSDWLRQAQVTHVGLGGGGKDMLWGHLLNSWSTASWDLPVCVCVCLCVLVSLSEQLCCVARHVLFCLVALFFFSLFLVIAGLFLPPANDTWSLSLLKKSW